MVTNLHWIFDILLVTLTLAFAGLAYWRYRRKVAQPLEMLVETITEFSVDPTVLAPIPKEVTTSPALRSAARALEELQRSTLRELRQRERLTDLGVGVAKINHDIRHSISTGMLVMDRVLETQDPRIRRAATIVKASLENAEVLCNTMSDYIIEPNVAEPVNFDIASLVQDVAEFEDIHIDYHGPDEIIMDPSMLQRMLGNLAMNAKRADATKIDIDIWKAGKLAVIDVEDNGKGIPEDVQVGLFKAFSGNATGTGLGLSIVRDLAVAQGGNVRLAHSKPGATIFRISLPSAILGDKEHKLLASKSTN